MRSRSLLATAFAVAAAAAPVAAQASPGLLLGIDDDALKWYPQTGSLLSICRRPRPPARTHIACAPK